MLPGDDTPVMTPTRGDITKVITVNHCGARRRRRLCAATVCAKAFGGCEYLCEGLCEGLYEGLCGGLCGGLCDGLWSFNDTNSI